MELPGSDNPKNLTNHAAAHQDLWPCKMASTRSAGFSRPALDCAIHWTSRLKSALHFASQNSQNISRAGIADFPGDKSGARWILRFSIRSNSTRHRRLSKARERCLLCAICFHAQRFSLFKMGLESGDRLVNPGAEVVVLRFLGGGFEVADALLVVGDDDDEELLVEFHS